MFEHEESEAPIDNKEMKIKLLDDLIEKIMGMEEGSPAEEKAESPLQENVEGAMGAAPEMKDKLAALKGV